MISKERIAQSILDFHRRPFPADGIIERDLNLELNIPIKRAITILGPRRSGKTYYLLSLIRRLIYNGIPKERTLYINFEDPKLIDITSGDMTDLLDVFYELYPASKRDKVWLFFDEIQNIERWEVFIRGVLDKENAQVFITGSSSKLLSYELSTTLRGRSLSYLLLPFSFSEILRIRGVGYNKYQSSEERAIISNHLKDYFSYGGYPEAVLYPQERERILQEIIDVTIYRDLIERYRIRNTKVIRLMFNYLVKAKEFSVHQFYNFLKSMNIQVSKNSLYNFLEFFNDAFVFFPLKKFSYYLKNIEQSIPKIYVVDNGIIELISGDDKGKKLENLVFLSLMQKGFKPNKDIFYYSENGSEVDFLIKDGKRVLSLIQCCFDISDYQTKERELKSLIRAGENLGCSDFRVITYDYESEERIDGKRVKYIPLIRFLLEGSDK